MPHRHDHGHDHHHHGHEGHDGHGHHQHAPASFGAAFAVGAALNIGLVAAQFIYGWLAGSVALMADAAHNLGDVLGLLLAWLAVALATRRPSLRRTYGWGRSSILAALANCVLLLVSAGMIALEALHRLAEPVAVAGGTVMVVAGAGIAVNGFTAWLFSRGHDDINIRATFQHMLADAGVSLGVVAGAVLIGLTGWMWLDPAISLAIVGVIVWGTWGVLRQSMDLAMDAVPASVPHEAVGGYLRGLPGVVEVHDLHIWALSTTETALTAHLVRDGGTDDQALIRVAVAGLDSRFRIGHATLQVETMAVAEACRLRPEEVV
jgi:cobalt-zinc-cadmium efflux system protein